MIVLRGFIGFAVRLIQYAARLGRFVLGGSPRKQRPPELAELEAKFYANADTDPERVWDRQFSNSIRSGRG